jgi:hypothetical protein
VKPYQLLSQKMALQEKLQRGGSHFLYYGDEAKKKTPPTP